jgi:hypothetical protein
MALRGFDRNVLGNATPEGEIPHVEEALKEIEIGFMDDGEDGIDLNKKFDHDSWMLSISRLSHFPLPPVAQPGNSHRPAPRYSPAS